MDTRTKITSAWLNLSHPKVRLVAGHFDPLLPEHVRHLEKLAQPDQLLIVVVTNPPDPLLPQAARAELLAALSMVDHVVMNEDVDETRITREFVDRVTCKSRAS